MTDLYLEEYLNLQPLLGSSIYTAVLFWLSFIGVCALGFVTVFTILYHRVIYARLLVPTFNSSFRPKCSIILPCKGLPNNFKQNLESFLHLDYDPYEVICTVESEHDPAVGPIREIITKDSRVSLVIAGLAETCSQKNHNMLQAIKKADNPDVYVFADSDIKLYGSWLSDLVLPLSRNDVTVTTGFRWLYSVTGGIGELTNVYQNIIIFVLFSFASFITNIGLWGGSMAIRRRDFEALGVGKFWQETVVDDMSLSRIIMKEKKKAVMVTPCVVPTDDALPTIKQSTAWFTRQMMFLKGYQKLQWYMAVSLAMAILSFLIWIPGALVISRITSFSFLDLGGAASLLLLFGVMATTLMYPFLGRLPSFGKFVMLQPVSLLTILHGILKTVITNTILWSGISYRLDFRGKVLHVKR